MIGADYIEATWPAFQTQLSDMRLQNKRLLDVIVDNHPMSIIYSSPVESYDVQHIPSEGKLKIIEASDQARRVYVLIKN